MTYLLKKNAPGLILLEQKVVSFFFFFNIFSDLIQTYIVKHLHCHKWIFLGSNKISYVSHKQSHESEYRWKENWQWWTWQTKKITQSLNYLRICRLWGRICLSSARSRWISLILGLACRGWRRRGRVGPLQLRWGIITSTVCGLSSSRPVGTT